MCRNSTIQGYSVSFDCPFGLTPVWFYGTRKNQRLKGRGQGWEVSFIYQSHHFLRLHTISPSFNAFNVTNANCGLWDTALYTRDREMTNTLPTLKGPGSRAQAIECNTSYGVTEETQAKCWGDRGGGGGPESALGAPEASSEPKPAGCSGSLQPHVASEHGKRGWSELRIKYTQLYSISCNNL